MPTSIMLPSIVVIYRTQAGLHLALQDQRLFIFIFGTLFKKKNAILEL